MTDTQQTIGKLLPEDAQRDAIHIAVAPIVACERLSPGEHVGLDESGCGRVSRSVAGPVGIVDPYLTAPVEPGQRFWLFLYPNTITSLRHQWEHPAFKAPTPEESEQWIREFAERIDKTYNALMRAADGLLKKNEYEFDNSESYKDVEDDDWETFWEHYGRVRGVVVPKDRRWAPYSCAC